MISIILVWSERLLALALLLQVLELLQLKKTWSDNGVWRWNIIRKHYSALPPSALSVLDFLLNEQNYTRLLRLSIASCVGIWFLPGAWHAPMVALLFFTSWLTSIRWRGIFNGGSDSMTAIIALCLTLARTFDFSPFAIKAALAYIAIHVTASYTIAGISKLRNIEWRNGVALSVFFNTPRYDSPPEFVRKIFEYPPRAKIISYALILWECCFPLAWINSTFCIIFLGLAFVFHLLNFWIFGLNRFVFAWLAGYPALFYWSVRP